MATVIDPGAGALSQALGRAGQRIAARVFEKENREKVLRADPTEMITLGTLARRAQAAGPEAVEALASSYGVRSEFVTTAAQGLLPGLQEKTEELVSKGGGAGLAARRILGETEVEAVTAEETLSSDIIGRRFTNELGRLLLDDTYNSAAMAAGLPDLQADAQAAGFKLDAATGTYNLGMLNLRSEEGIPKLTVDVEEATKSIELEALTGFQQYLTDLPDTPLGNHFRNMAAIAIADPNFANHVTVHEQLDANASASLAGTSQNPGDMLLNYNRWRDAMNDALDRSTEAGNAEERNQALRDINGLTAYGEAMIMSGAMLPVEIPGARLARNLIGIRNKLEIIGIKPERLDPMSRAAAQVVSGTNSIEDLMSSPSFQSLDPEMQVKLIFVIEDAQSQEIGQAPVEGQPNLSPNHQSFFSQMDSLVRQQGVGSALQMFMEVERVGLGRAVSTFMGSKGIVSPTREEIYNNILSDSAKSILDGN